MEKYTRIGSNPYLASTGMVSVKHNNHRQVHIPVIKIDGVDEVNPANDISYLPQKLQNDINVCFDFYGRDKFEAEELARRIKVLADNPPSLTKEAIHNLELKNSNVLKALCKIVATDKGMNGDQFKELIKDNM